MGQVLVQMDSTSSGVMVKSMFDFFALALARSQAVLAGLFSLLCLEASERQFLQKLELMLN